MIYFFHLEIFSTFLLSDGLCIAKTDWRLCHSGRKILRSGKLMMMFFLLKWESLISFCWILFQKMFSKNKFPNEHNALYHLPRIISFRKFNVLRLATLVLIVYSDFRCCRLYNVIDFIIDCRYVFVCRLKGTYC